jgi:hypothetical protein
MAKKILIGAGLFLLVFIIGSALVIALQPSQFSVERSTTMAAPPAAVFAQVNDLQAWDAWSPWSKLDPNAKTNISTPSSGEGATFGWNGNDQIGEGTLTILESKPDELVDVEQSFVRPFAGKCRMTFRLAGSDAGTHVTWRMEGTNDFFGRAMCLFMDMDAIMGKSFDEGLANIKGIVEKVAVEKEPEDQAAAR